MDLRHKTRGKHEKCPKCGNLMKRLYIKHQQYKKKTMKTVGWLCMKCKNVEIDDQL